MAASPFPPPEAGTEAGPSPAQGAGFVLATWPQRVLAFLLDFLLILAVVSVGERFGAAFFGDRIEFLVVLLLGTTFAYFLGANAFGGRSPGKRLLHLRTVSVNGARPSMGQGVVDAAGKASLVTGVGALFEIAGGLLVGKGLRQRLSQRAAGTIVVFEPPAPPRRVVFVP